jgi:hypothetical protein
VLLHRFLVDRETPGVTWVGIYADPKGLTWEAMIKIPRDPFFVDENQLVHIVGGAAAATGRGEQDRDDDPEADGGPV